MKFEDLVWSPVEGKSYEETLVKLDEKTFKIVKLDEDSFRVYLSDSDEYTECDLSILEKNIKDESFKSFNKEIETTSELIQEIKTTFESSVEFFKKEVERALSLEWNKPNEQFKYPYIVLNEPSAKRTYEMMRLDEDSYLIRSCIKNQTQPINFTEANKKMFLLNYGVSRNLDVNLFMSYLEKYF